MIKINLKIQTAADGVKVAVYSQGEAETKADSLYFDCLKFGIQEGIKCADAQMAKVEGAPATNAVLQLQPLADGPIIPIAKGSEPPLFSQFEEELMAAFRRELEQAQACGDSVETPLHMAERHERIVREACARFNLKILSYQKRMRKAGEKLMGGRN